MGVGLGKKGWEGKSFDWEAKIKTSKKKKKQSKTVQHVLRKLLSPTNPNLKKATQKHLKPINRDVLSLFCK